MLDRANAGRAGGALVGDLIFFDVSLCRSGSDALDWLLEEEEGFRCRPTNFHSLVGAWVGEHSSEDNARLTEELSGELIVAR